MLIAIWPLLIAIVGLLIWGLVSETSKLSKVGYVLFCCGTLALCFALASHTVRLG